MVWTIGQCADMAVPSANIGRSGVVSAAMMRFRGWCRRKIIFLLIPIRRDIPRIAGTARHPSPPIKSSTMAKKKDACAKMAQAILEMNPDMSADIWTEPDFKKSHCREFCKKLLNKDPDKRLGAGGCQEIMDHQYFSELDFDAIVAETIEPPFAPGKAINAKDADAIGEFESLGAEVSSRACSASCKCRGWLPGDGGGTHSAPGASLCVRGGREAAAVPASWSRRAAAPVNAASARPSSPACNGKGKPAGACVGGKLASPGMTLTPP